MTSLSPRNRYDFSLTLMILRHVYSPTSRRLPPIANSCYRRSYSSKSKETIHQNEAPLRPRVAEFDSNRLRNIGIVAHINAGKTTTTERILYYAGSTDSVGDVDKGNTVTDYLSQERDRGITITSAAVTFDWNKHRINLIDTPGHVDFTIEVERSLSVLDSVATILDASAGVEAQTTTVWNQAAKYRLPNVIFLNKYDKPQANLEMCLKDLRLNLGVNASLIQLPVKTQQGFSTILDIINRKCLTWSNPDSDKGISYKKEPLTGTNLDKRYQDLLEEGREKIVNYLSDIDDDLASHVLECDKISDVSGKQISDALRRATLKSKISPVLVGSSFKYIGVQQLMDAIVDYLPSPVDREKELRLALNGGQVKKENSPESCAFIFKIMHDKRLGPLTYLRVCNGSISKGQRLKNLDTKDHEQVKKVYRAFADELKEIETPVKKDDIVVVGGLTKSRTGEILVERDFQTLEDPTSSDEGNSRQVPFRLLNQHIIVPKISPIVPVYYCSIESKSISQQLKLEHALDCLSLEDPSFTYEIDELGITTVRGMGKLHLDIIRDRIASEYGVDPLLGPLQISYRETIKGFATESLTVNRLINSVKSALEIKIYIRPKPQAGPWTGKMLRLDTSADSSLGKLRNDHRKAIEGGFLSALAHGPSLGYQVVDCDVLLLDFKANSRCSLPLISSAASQCLTSAIQRSSPVLLEPIMLLEVVAPKEYNGVVLSDLSARRATVLGTVARSDHALVIRAHTPLSTLANYSESLRIKTSGRASFSMELHSYCPMSEADKLTLGHV